MEEYASFGKDTKFGPCPKCGDFRKPCRCWFEKRHDELIDELNTLKRSLRTLVNCCLQEARDKHLIDILNDDYLNEDHHLEITLTVGEIKQAAKLLKPLGPTIDEKAKH